MKKGKNNGKKKEKKEEKEKKEKIEKNIWIKVLVLGDPGTGKSSFIKAYLEESFPYYLDERVSQESFKTIDSPEGQILFVICEYDGTVRPINEMSILPAFDHFPTYREIFSICTAKFDYIILLYDSTRRETFEGLNEYLELIKKNDRQDPLKIYLFGTKSDIDYQIEVSEEEPKKFAEERNIYFKKLAYGEEEKINDINEIFNDIATHYLTTDSFKEQKQKLDKEEEEDKDKDEEAKKKESRKKKCNII